MNFRNPFRSLTWNSLCLGSRRRLRRVRRGFASLSPAAEILEVRSLLSGNVVAAAAGTALTLTSDSGDNSVNVYRLDATHVEIDGFNGTTINGAASQTFALASVAGITVNLGSGYDTYNIFSAAGDPALNIGAGGILFRGAAGGGTGDDLEVYNESSSAMIILGNVTERGSTIGSALVQTTDASYFYVNSDGGALIVGGSIIGIESGDASSDQEAFTYTGDLTVNGSVFFTASGTSDSGKYSSVESYGTGNVLVKGSVTQNMTSADDAENEIYTYSGGVESDIGGNVTIRGSVTETATGTGSANAHNNVETESTGNITIGSGPLGGGVTQYANSAGAEAYNYVETDSPRTGGNITIGNSLLGVLGGSVKQTAIALSSTTDTAYNYVLADSAGSIAIAGSVTQSASVPDSNTAYNYVEVDSTGNITIGGFVKQTASAGADSDAYNYIWTNSDGNIAIGLGVTQKATAGDDSSAYNYIWVNSDGSITIGLGAVQTAWAGDSSDAYNYIWTNSDGNIAIGLGATQTATAGDDSSAYNYIWVNSDGSITIGLGAAQTAWAGDSSDAYNYIWTNSDGNIAIGLGAVQTATAGDDSSAYNYIWVNSDGSITIGRWATQTAWAGDSSDAYNYIWTNSDGNIAIGRGAVQTASAGASSSAYNYIWVNSDGSITIGLGTAQTAKAGDDSSAYNYVEDDGSGNIAIAGSVKQTATDTGEDGNAYSYVITGGTGNITIGGFVTQTATGDDEAENWVEADGDTSSGGNISIGLSVTQTATLTESDDDDGVLYNDVVTYSFGSITIKGGVTQIATSAFYQENEVYSQTSYGGAIHVGGLIVMKSTTTGSGDLGSNNEVFADGGDVSALGVIITDVSSQTEHNQLFSTNGADLTIGLGGVTINGSGSGFHDDEIYADPGTSVTIAGSVVIHDAATGIGNQYLEIDGDTFIGGALAVTMNGPEATIHINDVGGVGTVEVQGLFHATMLGTSPFILVGDDEGSGASPVIFDSGVSLVGSSGAGATFEYDPANVTTPFITPVFFTIVTS